MKFSNNYIFYPDNKPLETAIAHYICLLDGQVDDFAPDNTAVQDNFIHTRGNYEQHRYSNALLVAARETLEANLAETARERSPLDWAKLQNYLGNILAAIGQNMRDDALFEQAIVAFKQALEEYSQEQLPLDWAATQYNLGTALQALGKQTKDSKLLKESVDAYTDALLEYKRELTPEQWSSSMFQLGESFHAHGKLLKGNRTFQKSVVAFKNALAELDADNYPLELAATHNNRGAVLHHLAESEENTERLEEAIRFYDTALTVCMEQQLPFHLAVLSRVNKGTARVALAELSKDAALAEEAADEFELIIECFPHALQPLCSKHCEEQFKIAKEMAKTLTLTG
ncbi:MAG: hypothetical protein V3V12_07235 [Gammaproteobacteria bacterium]